MGRAGLGRDGIFLVLWQKEMYLLPSLLLVGNFCRNCVFSLNIRPSVTYRLRPFCKIPNMRFFLVYQSLCLTFCVGVACLGNRRNFSSLGGACYAHKTNGDFLDDQCDRASLQLTVETKIFVILMFGQSRLKVKGRVNYLYSVNMYIRTLLPAKPTQLRRCLPQQTIASCMCRRHSKPLAPASFLKATTNNNRHVYEFP